MAAARPPFSSPPLPTPRDASAIFYQSGRPLAAMEGAAAFRVTQRQLTSTNPIDGSIAFVQEQPLEMSITGVVHPKYASEDGITIAQTRKTMEAARASGRAISAWTPAGWYNNLVITNVGLNMDPEDEKHGGVLEVSFRRIVAARGRTITIRRAQGIEQVAYQAPEAVIRAADNLYDSTNDLLIFQDIQ